MMIEDLQESIRAWGCEVSAEMRRMVSAAEAHQALDLRRFGLLASLETLLTVTEATCAAIIYFGAEKEVAS